MGLRFVHDWLERSRSRRQYFDEDLEQELLDLLEVSALLEIKEFALFELAYKEWYGRIPLPRVIEAHFTNYMFHSIIPAWVTSYTRHVLALQQRGELDPRKLGVYKRLPSKRLMAIGKLYTAMLLVTLLLLTAVAYRDHGIVKSLFGRADSSFEVDRPRQNAMP